MDRATVVALIAVVGTMVTAVFTYRASNQATDVNARAGELLWVKELRQDAIDARKEVAGLREEVRVLRRQLDVATGEADHWIGEAQMFRRHVWRTGMTIERMRELVGPVESEGGGNGRVT